MPVSGKLSLIAWSLAFPNSGSNHFRRQWIVAEVGVSLNLSGVDPFNTDADTHNGAAKIQANFDKHMPPGLDVQSVIFGEFSLQFESQHFGGSFPCNLNRGILEATFSVVGSSRVSTVHEHADY
jgi:hypothetical protein